jgi:hypothetical protein
MGTKYVIVRNSDGAFVTRPGSKHSYSKYLQSARIFHSREEALANACENEQVVSLESLLSY